MSGELRRYPAYRDTGLPWLGEIPAHWEVRRNGRLFSVRRELADPELPLLEVSLRTGVRVRLLGEGARKQVMADRTKYQVARAGDIVYNTMRMWQGAVGVAPVDGLVSPAYVVVRPNADVEPRYYVYLFRTPAYLQQIEIESRGIVPDRNRLYWEAFRPMPSVAPPLEEQRKIADYLDGVTRGVRQIETAKQHIRAALDERWVLTVVGQLVAQASTAAERKTSVSWLGDVPVHWQVSALRHRYSVDLGKMLDTKEISGEHLLPYLRNVDVQWGRINSSELPLMDVTPSEYDRYTVRPGDLLVCEGGEVGRAAFWDGQLECCAYQKALHRVRALDASRDNPRYLYHLLFAASKLGVFLADGKENTIAHLTREALRAHRFPFPPRDEQDRIVAALDEEATRLGHIAQAIQRELTLLSEYRSCVIADMVSGHADVRHLSRLAAGSVGSDVIESIEDEVSGSDDLSELEAVMSDAD